ncbi:hypothetical protein [Lichenifustis flavocetrariae]|uniref:Uncharacterized protein n=1 Tax=Lichenifustis flavocetrariae TaxID=2949735 RepID=A0AA42CN14_9HYPH|nr:hypothetical protein [Lichenifustis flavocetrariae]MCW6512196.1 hypothetical protein [Lichenifustis flavocetrariae]
MRKPFPFSRRSLPALVAAPMIFGVVTLSALASPASADTSVFPRHDYWRGFAVTANGHSVFGVATEMTHGGTVVFQVSKTGQFILTNPEWDLTVGNRQPVRMRVGGTDYTAAAIARSPTEVEVVDMAPDTLDLSDTMPVTIDVGNGNVHWTLDLKGFDAAMQDAVRAFMGT